MIVPHLNLTQGTAEIHMNMQCTAYKVAIVVALTLLRLTLLGSVASLIISELFWELEWDC